MPTTKYSKVKVTREAQEDAKSRAKPKHSQIPFQPWKGDNSKPKVLSKAKALSKRAKEGHFFTLSREEQQLVEDYDCDRLDKSLRRLVARRAPVYRGVGASVESNAPDSSSLDDSSAAQPAPKSGGPAELLNSEECKTWLQAVPSQEIF